MRLDVQKIISDLQGGGEQAGLSCGYKKLGFEKILEGKDGGTYWRSQDGGRGEGF